MQIPDEKVRLTSHRFSCIIMVALLYLITSVQAVGPIDDPDMWWRFRTGQWILENHAIPMQDYFSRSAMGQPWVEYSWLFELLIYVTYASFDLSGVMCGVVLMALLITFVTHRLIRGFQLPLTVEIALVAAAMGAMKPLITPRPWLFTIVLFCLELLIIDRARCFARPKQLWILPAIFVFWANIHIQFVYGLAVLGLLLAEGLAVVPLQRRGIRIQATDLSLRTIMGVLIACVVASLVNPYHYLLYKQVFDYVVHTGAFFSISELHPMLFRSPDSWLVLLLTLGTAFILGWRRRWLPFPMLLFVMASLLAFRARRDAWILALTAIWVIADSGRELWQTRRSSFSKGETAVSALLIAVAIALFSISRQTSPTTLQAAIEQKFPVRAVEYVNQKQLSGPLFNNFDWGGFLIWSLPRLPVVIDGRSHVHSDERMERSLNTWNGGPGWDSDPDLNNSKLIIAERQRPLVSLLRSHPRFEVAYEDMISVVFVATK